MDRLSTSSSEDDIPEYEIISTSPINIPSSSSSHNRSDSLQFKMSLSPENEQVVITLPSTLPAGLNSVSLNDESPEKNPSTDENSLLNPPDNVFFSFKLKPVRLLKQAVDVLSDADFNNGWHALFFVDESGLKISVKGNGQEAGVLSFSSSDLFDFQCRHPFMESRMVHLRTINERLNDVKDDATVLVYQLEGSNTISFMFETNVLSEVFSLKIYSTLSEKPPQTERDCYGGVHSQDIIQFFKSMGNAENAVVSVEISNIEAIFGVTDDNRWKDECLEFKLANTFNDAILSGKLNRAWFKWRLVTTLMKACHMQPVACVQLHKSTATTVVFQFELKGKACLQLLTGVLEVYPPYSSSSLVT